MTGNLKNKINKQSLLSPLSVIAMVSFTYYISENNPTEGRLYGLAMLAFVIFITFVASCISYYKLRRINASNKASLYPIDKTFEYFMLHIIMFFLFLFLGVATRLSDNPEISFLYLLVIFGVTLTCISFVGTLFSFFSIPFFKSILDFMSKRSQVRNDNMSILAVALPASAIYWPSVLVWIFILVIGVLISAYIYKQTHPDS